MGPGLLTLTLQVLTYFGMAIKNVITLFIEPFYFYNASCFIHIF